MGRVRGEVEIFAALAIVDPPRQPVRVGYRTFEFFDVFLLVAVVYLVLTALAAEVLQRVERQVYVPGVTTVGGGA